jgi:hypothetical protein
MDLRMTGCNIWRAWILGRHYRAKSCCKQDYSEVGGSQSGFRCSNCRVNRAAFPEQGTDGALHSEEMLAGSENTSPCDGLTGCLVTVATGVDGFLSPVS